MEGRSRPDRYAEVAAAEVKARKMRAPIWTKAMIQTRGDLQAAEDLYVILRAQQMEEDESAQEKSREARLHRDHSESEPRRLLSKVLLLCLMGLVFLTLVVAIYWLQSRGST